MSEENPEALFHYTSVATVPKIIEGRSIWATHYAYLNDHSELRHGLGVMERYVVNERRPGSPRGIDSKLYSDLLHWLQRDFPINHNVFVCCFSTKGNQLSQWRSYTPPRKGVCIGFSFNRVQKLAVDQGFQLAACEYEPEHQARAAAVIMDEVVSSAERDTSRRPYEVFRDWTERVVERAIRMKHKAFEEEREWRLWTHLPEGKHDSIQFREGASSLVPYVTFELSPAGAVGTAKWPFVSIRVGPTSDERAARNAILQLMVRHGFVGMRIPGSDIPFRN